MIDTGAAEGFYAARDARTVQYGASSSALLRPILLVVSASAAGTLAGQLAALAAAEMLLGAHHDVTIVAPAVDAVLVGHSGDLNEVLSRVALSIDPFNDPAGSTSPAEIVVIIGEGSTVPTGLSRDDADVVVARWTGGRGEISVNGQMPTPLAGTFPEPTPDGDVLGAATAACLAAAAAFRLAHGDAVGPSALNLLERTEGASASTITLTGPVDIGDVMVVGAGAVAHALAFWVRAIGHCGRWTYVDGDDAEIHNTGRCLGMTVADAGWPGGVAGAPALKKAQVCAALMGAASSDVWFDEVERTPESRPDLTLLLANERGVRHDLASAGEKLLIHATTSENWTAELHRHIAGRDDCPACRLPTKEQARLVCSTGTARPGEVAESSDAALPFLSAAAGLLLAIALLDLGADQRILQGSVNHWRLHLELAGRLWQRLPWPGNACPHTLEASVRDAINRLAPRRWDRVP